jgi:2-polyprenyl-3-methyl-5-hydroxy-6-metoxy-1,4-benzoquinol methylase
VKRREHGCGEEYRKRLWLALRRKTSPHQIHGESGKKFDAVISSEVVEHLFSPHLLPLYAKAFLREPAFC